MFKRIILIVLDSARVFSANANVAFNFWGNFGAKLNLWAAYGQNDTDKRPLYQIRPLEAQLNLDYEDYAFFGKFNVGSALRAVAKQTRRDDDTNKGLGIDRDKAGLTQKDKPLPALSGIGRTGHVGCCKRRSQPIT